MGYNYRMSKNVSNVPKNPYYELEFQEFIKNIGNTGLSNWSITAEALGVSRKTITRWKQHPIAKKAIAKSIGETIAKMEAVGKNDWRMYREKLRMLGIKDKQSLSHEILDTNEIEQVLNDLERTNYEEFAKSILKETEKSNLLKRK